VSDRRRASLRRTWPQRGLLAINGVLVVACIIAALLVWFANNRLGAVERVDIRGTDLDLGNGSSGSTVTSASLPSVDPKARNFLVVGTDSRDSDPTGCVDPNSRYAGAFGPAAGNRPDTIMVVRVDPEQNQAAILSLPRDLWVKIADTNNKGKINSSFDGDNPAARLAATIEGNFGIHIDHYVEASFCAFKRLVNVLGGVKVPFQYPAKDDNTGFYVAQAGCVTLDGDAAVAYARSRHFQYDDGTGFKEDPTSDYGRIARQQDFIRRLIRTAVNKGARQPSVAKQLIDAALAPGNLRIDTELTINDLLGLSSMLRSVDPDQVRSYRAEGKGARIGSADVIIPDLTSAPAKAILSIFQGTARLADAPDTNTLPGVTTTGAAEPATTTTTAAAATATTAAASETTALPTVSVDENAATGIVPPDDPSCR
jgi:LCP family protein required for cell wall assembly